MKRIARVVLLAALLFGAGAVILERARGQAPESAPVSVSEVLDSTVIERGALTVTVGGTGAMRAARRVGLMFEASAPVLEVLAEAGDPVRAGDVLARLEATDLVNALADAEVALEMQQVAYEGILSPARDVDVAAAEAALNAAYAAAGAAGQGPEPEQVEIARLQAEMARNQLWQQQLQRDQLFERGMEFRGAPATGAWAQEVQVQSGLTSAEYNVEIQDTNYANVANQGPDQAGLSSAQAQVAQAQVRLDRVLNGAGDVERARAEIALQQAALRVEQARQAAERAVLVAPFDGVIAESNLVVGEAPPAQRPALVLLDTSRYSVDLAIDETDIASIALGQPAELALDALGDELLAGTVSRVAVVPTRQGELVTYAVRVDVAEDAPGIRAGMTATATITVVDLDSVLVVPNRFLRLERATGRAFVTVAREDGRFEEVEVRLGQRNQAETEVLAGLEEGQTVVLLPRSTFNPLGG